MQALKSKVAKIERARSMESEAGRDDHRRMMQVLNGALVAHQPELEQVRPDHTDPETYRDIQETLAWARGDYSEAERLHDLDPNKHVPPPPGTPWVERMRLAREALDRTFGDAGDKTERVRAAVARVAARATTPLHEAYDHADACTATAILRATPGPSSPGESTQFPLRTA